MIFDTRLHPAALNQADVETLKFFDITGALLVSDGTATATVDGLVSHFDSLIAHVERFRRGGVKAWAALGVHPRALPRRGLEDVLEEVAPRCTKNLVAAWGMVGLSQGGPIEEHALLEQLSHAKKLRLPVFLSTPARQREASTRRVLALIREAKLPAQEVMIDGATPSTVRLIRECGHYAGLTLHPAHLEVHAAVNLVRQLGPERLVAGSAGGDGGADLLAVARFHRALERGGPSADVVEHVCRINAATWLEVRTE